MYILVCTDYLHVHTLITLCFHNLYIDGKENVKMTGYRMKMLMLTLPFMVWSRGTPMHVCTGMYYADAGLYLFVLVCTRLS